MKVAIIIPTMNRPEFVFRQLKFYELMKSPHPVYLSDSSNEENAKKLQEGIKEFKNFNITYQWVPPGKDCLYKLLPLVREKYCMQMGDDDIMIPSTISECAEFLELHPDYGTCAGKQVNIRFRKEDYNKPYGVIESLTRPIGRSLDGENVLDRDKDFWSDTFFISFVVRRTETEKKIRDISKNFSIMSFWTEFLIVAILIASGKSKILNKLGYVMQISNNRYIFDQSMGLDLLVSLEFKDQWSSCLNYISAIFHEDGISNNTSRKMAFAMMGFDLAHHLQLEAEGVACGVLKNNFKKKSNTNFISRIYNKIIQVFGGDIYKNGFYPVKKYLEGNRV